MAKEAPLGLLSGKKLPFLLYRGIKLGEGKSSIVEAYPLQPNVGYSTAIAVKHSIAKELDGAISSDMWREVSFLTRLDHPNVVKLLDVFFYPGAMGLVLPYADGSLANQSKNLTQQELKSCLLQVVRGLAYIHSRDVVHVDLKPQNVLVYRDDLASLGQASETNKLSIRAVISDFGLSRLHNCIDPSKQTSKDLGFTPRFRSPEAYYGAPSTPASDMWSLGIMIHDLVTKHYLFRHIEKGNEAEQLVTKIEGLFGTPTEAEWPRVTKLPNWDKYHKDRQPQIGNWFSIQLEPTLKVLLSRILIIYPQKRVSALGLKEDPWFDDVRPDLGRSNLWALPIQQETCIE